MAKEHHITLSETAALNDSVAVTSWLTPRFYLEEFESYKKKYFNTEESRDLVMAYILLQFYLENHFHYYLRFLIGGGFSSLKIEAWNERCYADRKLDWFLDYLTSNNFVIHVQDFEIIKDNYKDIANTRNSFAHGHPVTETNDGFEKISSAAKNLLTRQEFNETCAKANRISELWNKVMTEVQNQRPLLGKTKLPAPHFFDNCKLQTF